MVMIRCIDLGQLSGTHSLTACYVKPFTCVCVKDLSLPKSLGNCTLHSGEPLVKVKPNRRLNAILKVYPRSSLYYCIGVDLIIFLKLHWGRLWFGLD